jgi:hypothetical protein
MWLCGKQMLEKYRIGIWLKFVQNYYVKSKIIVVYNKKQL